MTKRERIFPKRPEEMEGQSIAIDTPMGSAYVTINHFEEEPMEVFVALGKTGSVERAMVEAIGRLCSAALQHGVPLCVLCAQLRGISSEQAMGLGPNKVLSVPDAIGKVMEEYENGRAKERQVHDSEFGGSPLSGELAAR